MAHINKKTRTATLTLAESMVIAREYASDGPEAHRVNRAMLDQVQEAADEIGRSIEVFACKRHGGHVVTVVEPRDDACPEALWDLSD